MLYWACREWDCLKVQLTVHSACQLCDINVWVLFPLSLVVERYLLCSSVILIKIGWLCIYFYVIELCLLAASVPLCVTDCSTHILLKKMAETCWHLEKSTLSPPLLLCSLLSLLVSTGMQVKQLPLAFWCLSRKQSEWEYLTDLKAFSSLLQSKCSLDQLRSALWQVGNIV